MEIKSKIYYNKLTGDVITITGELSGSVIVTTKEEDLKNHLENILIDDVELIELEYGTFAETFLNAKSYHVNVESKELKVIYYTQEELDEMSKPSTDDQHQNAVNTISQYLYESDTSLISEVEDLILNKKENEILGAL